MSYWSYATKYQLIIRLADGTITCHSFEFVHAGQVSSQLCTRPMEGLVGVHEREKAFFSRATQKHKIKGLQCKLNL